ncbi:cellulose biosynthesis protein BcsO [Pantoea sp. FN060301]|uniref:cellulose biosynthesis protein BcsO n=1 Tax=Pantoea sp. FN060301 TaxID=3420380 RepID=UPI003D16C6CC
MKSYDDLQRFKEKTHTNHIEFKDMSGQTKNSDSTGWAIIQQLSDEGTGSGLGNGQRVDVTAPQPIKEDIFRTPAASAPAAQNQPQAVQRQPAQTPPRAVQPQSIAATLSAKPAAQPAGSLLETISASLKPVQTEVAEAPVEETPTFSGSANAPAPTLFTAVSSLPVAAPPAEQPRFKQLFSSVPETPQTLLPKETLLQPLLERIALCR